MPGGNSIGGGGGSINTVIRKWLEHMERRRKPGLPKSRSYWRRFYYSAIKHDLSQFEARYSRKAPKWLLAEIQAIGPEKWLLRWNGRTGRRREGPRVLRQNSN